MRRLNRGIQTPDVILRLRPGNPVVLNIIIPGLIYQELDLPGNKYSVYFYQHFPIMLYRFIFNFLKYLIITDRYIFLGKIQKSDIRKFSEIFQGLNQKACFVDFNMVIIFNLTG